MRPKVDFNSEKAYKKSIKTQEFGTSDIFKVKYIGPNFKIVTDL